MTVTINNKNYFIRKIYRHTATEFDAFYKGCHIIITTSELINELGRIKKDFYVWVGAKDGCAIMEAGRICDDIEEAIKECVEQINY